MILLEKLCYTYGVSGDEEKIKNLILEELHKMNLNLKIFHGKGFQNCIIAIKGNPKTAIYSHIDSLGFMVGYNNEIIGIGTPKLNKKDLLCDSNNPIQENITKVKITKKKNTIFSKNYQTGDILRFAPNFIKTDKTITSTYLDNRIGVYVCLNLLKECDNIAVAFTCWEETGGGSAGYLAKFLYDEYKISQAIISDITWVTEGVKHDKGVVVSLKDVGVPPRNFVNKILKLGTENNIKLQKEVEKSGGSDGWELQKSILPIDWCFVGTPIANAHCSNETVYISDINETIKFTKILMDNL